MSASPRLRFGIVAAGLSCLFAGYVVAQQEQQEQEIQREQPAAVDQLDAPGPAAGQTDRSKATRREYTANFRGNPANAGAQQDVQRYIVGCLLAKNQAEVEMGKFAQQQSQSPEVKEFAQMLVQDHGKLIQKIQQVARADAADGQPTAQPGDRTRPAAGREAAGQNAVELDATNRAAGNNSAVDQLIALEQQIVERSTQSAKEDLQQKQGAEFDKCYVGSQIVGHAHMLSALEVLQQQGPEAVQQLAQEAQPGVKKHLEHAKQLMKQLEGAGAAGSRAARQPTQPQR
jgi:predicted outer membrane protein